MKVLFCCINSKFIHSSPAPWCLFAACKEKCDPDIQLAVTEGTINEDMQAIEQRILEQNPQVISFSCYIWNITQTLSLSESIKKKQPQVRIIFGGPEVAYRAEQVLTDYAFVDFTVSGAGEVNTAQLIDALYRNENTDADGVSYRNADGTLHINTNESPTDDSISPYCEEYLHSLNGRIAYMESSRGCPFRCAFCLSGRIGKVRYMPMEKVKKEILLLANSGTKTVKFVDRTFNCNAERAAEILAFIHGHYGKDIPTHVCFHFEISADLLTEELFSVIEKLPQGCVQFEIGIQSFNEETLRAINRTAKLDLILKNTKRLLQKGNCHIHIDLIAGLPKEDLASFINGFNRAYALKADMLQLGFLKILHGSPMAENKELYPCDHCCEPPYEVQCTPYITREELQKLHVAENELERLYNSGRFRNTLDYILKATSLSPFDLFYGFGLFLQSTENRRLSLDAYTDLVFDYFGTLCGVDKAVLRDKMIYDRIATNSSGVIPDRLKVADPLLKKVKNALRLRVPVQKGVNRSVAVLYSENKVIFCDYLEKNKVSGQYTVHSVPLEDLLQTET